MQQEDGAYAEYILVKDGIFGKVPDFMSMEDAATLAVSAGTNGQVLAPEKIASPI